MAWSPPRLTLSGGLDLGMPLAALWGRDSGDRCGTRVLRARLHASVSIQCMFPADVDATCGAWDPALTLAVFLGSCGWKSHSNSEAAWIAKARAGMGGGRDSPAEKLSLSPSSQGGSVLRDTPAWVDGTWGWLWVERRTLYVSISGEGLLEERV